MAPKTVEITVNVTMDEWPDFRWEDSPSGERGLTRRFICNKCDTVFHTLHRPLFFEKERKGWDPSSWSVEAKEALLSSFRKHLPRCDMFKQLKEEDKRLREIEMGGMEQEKKTERKIERLAKLGVRHIKVKK